MVAQSEQGKTLIEMMEVTAKIVKENCPSCADKDARIKAWEDRFAAIVGERNPDSAGNEVITLKSRIAALKRIKDKHDADAKEANFDRCGCDYCKALRGDGEGGNGPDNET